MLKLALGGGGGGGRIFKIKKFNSYRGLILGQIFPCLQRIKMLARDPFLTSDWIFTRRDVNVFLKLLAYVFAL